MHNKPCRQRASGGWGSVSLFKKFIYLFIYLSLFILCKFILRILDFSAALVFARYHWRIDKCHNIDSGRCENRRRGQWFHIWPGEGAGGHCHQTRGGSSGFRVGNRAGSEGHCHPQRPQVSHQLIFLIHNAVKPCINAFCNSSADYLSSGKATIIKVNMNCYLPISFHLLFV